MGSTRSVPNFHSAPPPDEWVRADRQPRLLESPTRRGFIKLAAAGATAMGLAALGVLPPMRHAWGSHYGTYGYRMRQSCPTSPAGSTYDQSPTNCGGCCCSRICSDCCYNNSANHKHGWHKEFSPYDLREGDCSQNGDWDGWKWAYSSCCGCFSSNEWRCHDGYKLDSSGVPRATVCKWTLASTFGCGCL